MRRVACLFFVVLLILFAGGSQGRAQAQIQPGPSAPSAPTYTVGTITVKFVGTANVNEQIVRANIQMREGGSLDDGMIDRDIRSLYKTGLFEFVEVKHGEVHGDRVIDLVIEVTPKYRILAIRYEGNTKVKSSRLQKEVKSKATLALDERQVKEDAEKIREHYQKSGYNQVSVRYTIDRDRVTGYGTVTFKIKEGDKVKISEIRFAGNEHLKARALRKVMETRRWHMFSWLTGSGRLKDDQFEDDLDKLRDYYREHGFLDVEIPPEKIRYDYPTVKKLVITIPVEEGRQYRVGEITIVGNKLYSQALLKRIIRQRTGSVFVPSKLDKDTEKLENFYGRDGYLDTRVRLIRKPNVHTGNIDIEYQVNESEKFFVESIRIEGNTKTKSTAILRELNLGPGDVFNAEAMKVSKLTLENTRFFEDVNLTDEPTNLPGRRDLKVSVKEGRTGNLQFGAGFSSLERATIFVEVSQGNFDLFNRRSLFQGDGQKFRLRLSLGSRSSEIILSFEEPWLFQKRLGLGFNLFRTSSDYTSAYYEEIRTGLEVFLRKYILPQYGVEARLAYSYQIIDINDVDPSASSIIQSFAGKSTVSKIDLMLSRDTRDKLINTTKGSYAEFNPAVAGGPLGADENYYSIQMRGSQFFPVFETLTQVLELMGRVGVIQNYGDSSSVPYYDRFTLGGPYNLRGFEYRDVGPKDSTNTPVGGKTYGFFSAEYSIDVVNPVRIALFYDAGFVNKGAYDFSPAGYNDNFGIGLRLFMAGAPLRLDFGIPLTTDKSGDKGNQFNFSFGTRY